MAEHDENSLIGYDPLAWMHQAEPHQHEHAVEVETLVQAIEAPEVPTDFEADSVTQSVDTVQPPSEPANIGETKGLLVLDSVLNIQNVSNLHRSLVQMLADFEAIDIDASAVTVVDTSTLQLLLILKQAALTAQKSITIDFPSDKFVEAADLLGLSEMLDVDQAASGFF